MKVSARAAQQGVGEVEMPTHSQSSSIMQSKLNFPHDVAVLLGAGRKNETDAESGCRAEIPGHSPG